eukprot:1769419-Pleurochrysis_carterae.AAC.6
MLPQPRHGAPCRPLRPPGPPSTPSAPSATSPVKSAFKGDCGWVELLARPFARRRRHRASVRARARIASFRKNTPSLAHAPSRARTHATARRPRTAVALGPAQRLNQASRAARSLAGTSVLKIARQRDLATFPYVGR